MGLQGELPVDLSTFNGLREQWLKETGKEPPKKMEPLLRKTAKNVSRAAAEEVAVLKKLSSEIERATEKRKLRPPEEVRDAIIERMKEGPCR